MRKLLVVLSAFVPVFAFGAGVAHVNGPYKSGSVYTYDVTCSDGYKGSVSVNGSAIAWNGKNGSGQSITSRVSVNEATQKVCR